MSKFKDYMYPKSGLEEESCKQLLWTDSVITEKVERLKVLYGINENDECDISNNEHVDFLFAYLDLFVTCLDKQGKKATAQTKNCKSDCWKIVLEPILIYVKINFAILKIKFREECHKRLNKEFK